MNSLSFFFISGHYYLNDYGAGERLLSLVVVRRQDWRSKDTDGVQQIVFHSVNSQTPVSLMEPNLRTPERLNVV